MPVTQALQSPAIPAARARFHPLIVREVRRETAEAVSIAFEVPDDLKDAYRFAPGQYLTLHAEVDGADLRRSYSICSGLDDGELRVAIKGVEGGRFSGFANARIAAGDILDVMPPMGRFGILPDPSAARTYVGLACGSGITPILSILKSVLSREPRSRFVLLYGNRTSRSILFRDAIDALKDRHLDRLSVFHVLSREAQDIPILNGRLDAERIARLLPAATPIGAIDHAFVCGPGGMIEDSERALIGLGVPDDRIHIERFTPADGAVAAASPPTLTANAAPHAIAEVVLDGSRTFVPVAEGEAILDAALRAGLDLPYSCRGGMCCTCRARIVDGAVRMEVNYSLEDWEIAAGYALTCQSKPTTGKVVVDYDHV